MDRDEMAGRLLAHAFHDELEKISAPLGKAGGLLSKLVKRRRALGAAGQRGDAAARVLEPHVAGQIERHVTGQARSTALARRVPRAPGVKTP